MNEIFTFSDLIASGSYECRDGKTLNLKALPEFIRVLLTTNGTVTKSLEAFFWERIAVQNIEQGYINLKADVPIINRAAGQRVLERKVCLAGQESGRHFAYATSLIATEKLPESVRINLEEGKFGIGELLQESALETYREILELGQDNNESVWRRYRIIMDHEPVMQITESFPLEIYREASVKSNKALNGRL